MTYVITQSCCNDAACVDVCPVDCIHPRTDEGGFDSAEMLHIDPAACVDCGACFDICPAGAIVADHEMASEESVYLDMARDYFRSAMGGEVSAKPFAEPATVPVRSEQLRVAIVGTGPSACYAAQQLLAIEGLDVRISMIDRLPVPGGLVRYGVAPDHLRTKRVAEAFDRALPPDAVDLYLNVEVGRDLSHDDLLRGHHAVIYAAGASQGRKLGIEGEGLGGSCTATEFVGWYNGHPDHAARSFDLSCRRAVIIGNGNVAIDVARILVMPPERLLASDIAEHARVALASSKIEEVVIVGRRGPDETAATTPELLALADLPGVDVQVEAADVIATSRKTALLAQWSAHPPVPGQRRIVFKYLHNPASIEGDGVVEGISLAGNGSISHLDCGLVIAAVGYMGSPIAGMPFDAARGTMIHSAGRVGHRTYVAGWMKRGPSGVIGTNKRCSAETVDALVSDFIAGRLQGRVDSPDAFRRLVETKQPAWLDRAGWNAIDRFEQSAAKGSQRVRMKLVSREKMLEVAIRD